MVSPNQDGNLYADVFFGGDNVATNSIANAVAGTAGTSESESNTDAAKESKVRDWQINVFVLNKKTDSYYLF